MILGPTARPFVVLGGEFARSVRRRGEHQLTSMLRAGLAGVVAFNRSYFFQLGVLDGAMGFAVCAMQAQGAFGKYFTLYCLNRADESKTSLPPA